MAGEDLLDQGRSGSGHADNEDRVRRRTTEAAPRREERRREYLLTAPHMVADVRGIVVDHRAAKPVAVGIMTAGPLRLSGILQGLDEREMQVEALRWARSEGCQVGKEVVKQ